MDILYKIWAFFGFLAFIQIGFIHASSIRMRRTERSEYNNLHAERSSVKDDMAKILAPYMGKEVTLNFYEDEEDWDLEDTKATLLDMDSKWALLRIEIQKNQKDKLIRISSIKGISIRD